jgi:hypothetical protein
LIFFGIVWLFCSFGWAFLAIAPLLIRCFATQIFRSSGRPGGFKSLQHRSLQNIVN